MKARKGIHDTYAIHSLGKFAGVVHKRFCIFSTMPPPPPPASPPPRLLSSFGIVDLPPHRVTNVLISFGGTHSRGQRLTQIEARPAVVARYTLLLFSHQRPREADADAEDDGGFRIAITDS